MSRPLPGERALFGLMPDHPDGQAGEYLFRCPTCDQVTAAEADIACAACAKTTGQTTAKKAPAKRRRRSTTTAGGGS